MARTSAEVKARLESVKDADFFGFESGDLIPFMSFEDAKPYLRDGVTEDQFREARGSMSPVERVADYLPFAWEKANDCRGISASRSVSHLKAWLWLAGFDVSDDFDRRYEYYGKPCLVTASEMVGFDWRSHDDNRWANDEDGDGISERLREALISDAIDAAKLHRSKVPA